MMKSIFSKDLFFKVIKNVIDLKIFFIILYFKKLILNSSYSYQKSKKWQPKGEDCTTSSNST